MAKFHIISIRFFGYFTAFCYCLPFAPTLLPLRSIPTPSIGIAFIVRFVLDANLLAYPFWSPSLPLFVVIAPVVRDVFGRTVRKAIALVPFAMLATGGIHLFLLLLLPRPAA